MNYKEATFSAIIIIVIVGLVYVIANKEPIVMDVPEEYGELIKIEVSISENFGWIKFIYEHGEIKRNLGMGITEFIMGIEQ